MKRKKRPLCFSRNKNFSFFENPDARRALYLFRVLSSLHDRLEHGGPGVRVKVKEERDQPTVTIFCEDEDMRLKRNITIARRLFRTIPHGRRLYRMYKNLADRTKGI